MKTVILNEKVIVIDDVIQTAYLYTMIINTDSNNVGMAAMESIIESEYSKYSSESDRWVSLQKWMEMKSLRHHWSGLKKIRIESNIRRELQIKNDQRSWVKLL